MLEEASEFFKEIRLGVSERLTSPLVGTYWISWFIWNFKFLLIIFSGENLDRKFSLVHESMFTDPYAYAWTYGGPLAMTILFIFAYPYPAQVVYEFRLKFQKKLNEIKQSIEDQTLLSVEDARALRLSIREKEREFISRLGAAEQEAEDLKRANDALKVKAQSPDVPRLSEAKNQEARRVPETKLKVLDGLNDYESAIVRIVSENAPNWVAESTIISYLRAYHRADGNVKLLSTAKKALDSLMDNHRLLIKSVSPEEFVYRLSDAGEKFAADNNF